MITVQSEFFKEFSQDNYNNLINNIQIHQLMCTCGKIGLLIFYGFYKRKIKTASGKITLYIQRVFCKECKKSHAILPAEIVPYSQVSCPDQQEIISYVENGDSPDKVLEEKPSIDENNVKHIIRQFRKHWKERLASINLPVMGEVVGPCFRAFSRQFMQIHRTCNTLYILTNIA